MAAEGSETMRVSSPLNYFHRAYGAAIVSGFLPGALHCSPDECSANFVDSVPDATVCETRRSTYHFAEHAFLGDFMFSEAGG